MYFCSWRTMKMASVAPLPGTKPNCISSVFTMSQMYPLQQLHDLICELETTIVATVKGFTFAPAEVQNWALLPVWWDHTTAENSLLSVVLPAQLLPHQQLSASQLHARWTSSLAAFRFAECFVDPCCRHMGRGTAVGGTSGSLLLGQIQHWAA